MGKSIVEEITWICRKCGLLRSNKAVHMHGVPLPEHKLKSLEMMENAKDNYPDASL